MEAVKAMKEGKKVKTGLWGRGAYVFLKDENIVFQNNKPFFELDIIDELKATDWEIYKGEDNWNLAGCTIMDYTDMKGEGPLIKKEDIKTFIQKVKEDVRKKKRYLTDAYLYMDCGDINEILDKRAGDLK